MKTFNVDGKLGKFQLNLPDTLSEITPEYLKKCTDFIHPAPNYALVGIVYKDNLNLILTSARKNQPAQLGVIPIFIKAGDNESQFISNLKLADKVVIAASDLSIGNHINSPYNKITPNNIIALCDGDRNIARDAIMQDATICLLEFKLVPISAIHAQLDATKNSFVNPFVTKTTSVGEA